jgi:hypothetical protein
MWDLATRCETQLRCTDLNGIVGFDRAIFFQTADALGYDRDAIAILIDFVEQGMLEKIAEMRAGKSGRESGDAENFGLGGDEIHG